MLDIQGDVEVKPETSKKAETNKETPTVPIFVGIILGTGFIAGMIGNVGVPIICGAVVISIAIMEAGEGIVNELKKK